MNIGIFTNNYLPNPYGVSGSIESFRKQFKKQGHSVFIFAPNYKNYQDKNPNVFRYPALDISYKIKFPIVIPYSPRIEKEIEKLDLDIIHSQHPNLLGTVARKWAKKKNIPLVFTWHTLYDQYTHFIPLIPEKITNKIVISQAVKYANQADQIIVPTPGIKNIIQKWGARPHTKKTSSGFWKRLFLKIFNHKPLSISQNNFGVGVNNQNIKAVPTGIEEDLYQNPDRNKIRNKFNIKEGEILLLLVSRLTQEKNIEFLFKAVIKILKNNSQAKFLIAGDGYLLPKLKELAKNNDLEERIIFEGIVAKEELKNYYAAGDIFVYASKSETQGMIISEAMYVGLPIVAVNAPGVCDLIQNNINGFLTSEGETEFNNAIQKLINDRDLRNKFSENSKQIARENYTDKICASKMLEIYHYLIEKR